MWGLELATRACLVGDCECVGLGSAVSEGKSGRWWGEPSAPPLPTSVQCCVDCLGRFSVRDWRERSMDWVSVVTVQGAREWMRVSLWCYSAYHPLLYISACSRVIGVVCVGHESEGSSRCDLKNEEEKSWQLMIAQVDDNNRWPSSSCSHYQTWKYQRFCLVDTSFLSFPSICMNRRRQTAINYSMDWSIYIYQYLCICVSKAAAIPFLTLQNLLSCLHVSGNLGILPTVFILFSPWSCIENLFLELACCQFVLVVDNHVSLFESLSHVSHFVV